MLIEAANYIPNWLQPSTAIHRVWIAPPNGALHIVPTDLVPHLGSTHKQAIEEALKTVHTNPLKTVAAQKVQNALNRRISSTVASNQPQWSACTLPVKVAYLFHRNPSFVAHAVNAFYHRDPISMKSAQNFERFGVGPKVNTMVRFSRCLFAQASSQHWLPPRAYGEQTKDEKNAKLVGNIAFDLGAKLACGFELFYRSEKDRANKISAKQALHIFPWAKDEAWKTYFSKLQTIGYFRGLPETHIKYQTLETKAKEKFLALNPDKTASVLPQTSVSEIDEILRNFEAESGKVAGTPKSDLSALVELFPDSKLFPSTSTAWMNISPEEIEQILKERTMEFEAYSGDARSSSNDPSSAKTGSKGEKKTHSVGDQAMGDEETMKIAPGVFERMAKDVESFLSKKSGLDGIDLEEDGETSKRSERDERNRKFDETGHVDFDEDEGDDFYGSDSDEEHADLEDLDEEMLGSGKADSSKLSAERTEMLELMREMDSELLETELGKSFKHSNGEDDDEDIDTNLNLVKNFIESYASQHGVAGPVSTLLSQLSDWRQRQSNEDGSDDE